MLTTESFKPLWLSRSFYPLAWPHGRQDFNQLFLLHSYIHIWFASEHIFVVEPYLPTWITFTWFHLQYYLRTMYFLSSNFHVQFLKLWHFLKQKIYIDICMMMMMSCKDPARAQLDEQKITLFLSNCLTWLVFPYPTCKQQTGNHICWLNSNKVEENCDDWCLLFC